MLRKVLKSYSKKASIILLTVITLVTFLSCMLLELKSALLIGLVLFILLGGINAIWVLIKDLFNLETGNEIDKEERQNFYDNTRNNPTLR